MSNLPMMISPEQCSLLLESNLSFADVADRVVAMQRQELTHYRCRDYIKKARKTASSSCQDDEAPIDVECREKMVEWCYQVTDFAKFSRHTVSIGMSYLDRFMCTSHPTAVKALHSKKQYQLAAMTCLYIAIKLFEPVAFDTALLSEISHGSYDEEDIEQMECDILQGLGWRMNGPTAHDEVNYLIMLLPNEARMGNDTIASALLDFSRYQAELAVTDYELAMEKPSVIALAAILNSSEGIGAKLLSVESRQEYVQNIMELTGMNTFSVRLNTARVRLLNLFQKNSGYSLPQIANVTPVISLEHVVFGSGFYDNNMVGSKSPVSVADTTMARCA